MSESFCRGGPFVWVIYPTPTGPNYPAIYPNRLPNHTLILSSYSSLTYSEDDGTRTRNHRIDSPVL